MAMLDELKTYLDITWDDEHTDRKLTGILTAAEAKLRSYAGGALDFDRFPDDKQLLFDCCRYIWNNASEDFEENYKPDLLILRAKYATERMTADGEDSDSGTDH